MAANVLQHGLIKPGADMEPPPRRRSSELPFLDHELPTFDHVAWGREHPRDVRITGVDRDVGIRAHSEMALVGETEEPSRTRPGHDRDLVEGVLPGQAVGQGTPG